MKSIILSLVALFITLNISAQTPKWFKKARKAQVTLYAIQAKGDTLNAQGCYIDEKGTLLTEFQPLEHAREAYVIDSEGNRSPIIYILGVNSSYNVAKVQAQVKKSSFLPLDTLTQEGVLYVLPAANTKSNTCALDTIAKAEKAGNYSYFSLTAAANTDLKGCPALNEAGSLVALVQPPYLTKKGAKNSALQAKMGLDLKMSSLDGNNSALKDCKIKRMLPAEESQAYTFVYLMNTDNETKISYIDDYIAAFPNSVSGYTLKAELLAGMGKYAEANDIFEQAIKKKTGKEDEILYSRAKVICAVIGQKDYPDWTLDKALEDATTAYSINPLPNYIEVQGNCLYSLGKYEEASEKYLSINKTQNKDPKYFSNASLCKQLAGADSAEVIALMDSALAMYEKPYPRSANTYLYRRAQLLAAANRTKEALADYDDFERIMMGQLNDNFYYEREQVANRTNRYLARALKDIQKAISLKDNVPEYYAEEGALYLRANELDESILACEKAIALDAKYADPYRLLGVIYKEKNNLPKAKEYLKKAVELGDTVSESILSKLGQ